MAMLHKSYKDQEIQAEQPARIAVSSGPPRKLGLPVAQAASPAGQALDEGQVLRTGDGRQAGAQWVPSGNWLSAISFSCYSTPHTPYAHIAPCAPQARSAQLYADCNASGWPSTHQCSDDAHDDQAHQHAANIAL